MGAATLLGRHQELGALRQALLSPECRLLTLTGPPGVGKTRLAATFADEVSDRFPDGVVEVDLLGSTSAEAVAALIGARFGIGRGATGSAVARLAGHLQDRTVLLVMDSCEAVPDLGPMVTAVLDGSRRVKVLATSQERVRVATEREYAVPPLAMPGPAGVGPEDLELLAAVPAMEMLLASIRAVRPDFSLDAGNVRALVGICRRLEGLPLALEVAAARLGQFEPAELAVRLENRHRLLDAQLAPSGRHRSLHAAIAWSHDLLGEGERLVFRRVAVFPGAWTLAAAAAVVADSDTDVVQAVASLVAKNLLRSVTTSDGTEAYDLLDTLRRYGREELERTGESAAVEVRFRAHYAALAETAEAGMGTPDEAIAVHWSDDDLTNLRAALTASVAADDLANALPLAAAAGWYWYTRGGLGEAAVVTDLVDRALDRDLSSHDQDALGGAVLIAGIIAWACDDLEAAHTLLQRACALAEALPSVRRGAIARAFLGHLARSAGDLPRARREHLTAQAAYVELGNQRGRAWASHDLALVALEEGKDDGAASLFADALSVFESDGDDWSCAWGWSGLAEVALRRAQWLEAGDLLVRALEVYAANGDQPRIAHCCRLLAEVARGRGLTSLAEDLTRSGLSTSRLIRLARSVLESTAVPTSPLTPRQREVAALVAEGATNRQIARRLGIADKTVEVHLAQIMARLDVHNRAQVATHAVQSGLEAPAR
ncbi:LuxR C-terminal-related transcriptional regulator [Marmoricola sp. URHB0036]|uniref:ATP-binding protein n=1 Tax=Marmoricola sp. URHB0036 TaxID=1298863 RepID=UPI000412F42B|nr:LuxR C-terminal-related transcriptional regulator [Marmoricola sp. URHB0036]